MRLSYLICLILISASLSAQKTAMSDSLWCDHLSNIIRCVSMAQIYEPVGKVRDSSVITPFVPNVRLTGSDIEVIEKKNNKVNYIADIQSATGNLKIMEAELDKWYKKIKTCLEPWDMARMDNRDKSVAYQDYFITNSEDETTVRISIVRSPVNHVRISIY